MNANENKISSEWIEYGKKSDDKEVRKATFLYVIRENWLANIKEVQKLKDYDFDLFSDCVAELSHEFSKKDWAALYDLFQLMKREEDYLLRAKTVGYIQDINTRKEVLFEIERVKGATSARVAEALLYSAHNDVDCLEKALPAFGLMKETFRLDGLVASCKKDKHLVKPAVNLLVNAAEKYPMYPYEDLIVTLEQLAEIDLRESCEDSARRILHTYLKRGDVATNDILDGTLKYFNMEWRMKTLANFHKDFPTSLDVEKVLEMPGLDDKSDYLPHTKRFLELHFDPEDKKGCFKISKIAYTLAFEAKKQLGFAENELDKARLVDAHYFEYPQSLKDFIGFIVSLGVSQSPAHTFVDALRVFEIDKTELSQNWQRAAFVNLTSQAGAANDWDVIDLQEILALKASEAPYIRPAVICVLKNSEFLIQREQIPYVVPIIDAYQIDEDIFFGTDYSKLASEYRAEKSAQEEKAQKTSELKKMLGLQLVID